MNRNSGKILIVDDLPENVMVVEKVLQKEGFVTEIATAGEEAIDRIKAFKPDLVLLDVLMPKVDGFEVARRIKANEDTKYVPIIFLTALNEPKYIVEGFKTGGVDFITKPFNLTELMMRVKTHVDLKKAQEANEKLIEQLRRANEDLNSAKIKLTELNANKDKFFSIIAHDLRNPFLGFFKLADFIHSEYENLSKEEIQEMVNDIYASAEKLNKLLENLLAWSRIQLGKVKPRYDKYLFKQIIDMNVNLFSDLAKSKNITINVDIAEDLEIITDLQMFNTVIRNIISNAVKFTHIFGEVNISAETDDNTIRLSIKDNGIGMSEDEINKLFSIDTQILKTGTEGEAGTGLGMILTKELLDKLGYDIVVKSELDVGTTFSIIIPVNNIPGIT
jgi:signal transduction histidine kinase